jgi:hypothetical protein
MNDDYYQLSKEWEFFDFPIEIVNIAALDGIYDFGPTCSIVIWRNDDYKLQAKISGYLLKPTKFEIGTEAGPGNFAVLETITGYRNDRLFRFTLHECVIAGWNQKGIIYPNLGIPFEAGLTFDYFTTEFVFGDEQMEPTSQVDWYIGNQFDVSFPKRTERKLQKTLRRTRVNREQDDDEMILNSSGSGWDWFAIDIPGVKCCVSQVPKQFGPSWAKCLAIEYRKSDGFIADENVKRAIKNLVGFLIGTELFPIGTAIFCGHSIISQSACSPLISGTQAYCSKSASPPIQLNRQYEWGNIEFLVNSMLPHYLTLMDELELNDILWRYFEATELTVGINLPVLSSAIESLANKYIRKMKLSHTYLPSKDYIKLIEPELSALKEKLQHIPESQKIVNKIKAACNRGANEKLDIFFESMGLRLSEPEKESMRARNAMAHGGSTYSTKEEAKPFIIKTHIYETLFHRILLRILHYEEYYIDYAVKKRPSKKISKPSGEEKK